MFSKVTRAFGATARATFRTAPAARPSTFLTASRRTFSSGGSTGSSFFRFSTGLSGAAVVGLGTALYMVATQTVEAANAVEEQGGLDSEKFQKLKVVDILHVNHNTRIYTIALPSSDAVLNLPIASFVLVQAPFKDDKGKPVVRPYTPISGSGDRGFVELMIKSYPQGVLSKHFGSLKIGDEVEIKGPIRKLQYTPNMKKKIGMIAGGSGITPMLQVAREVLSNTEDNTQLSLVYANVTEEDIMLKPLWDMLAKQYPDRFKVHYVLDNPSAGWKEGSAGRTTLDLIKKHMPPPSNDNMIFVCGPPGMMTAVSGQKAPDFSQGELSGLLKEAGYNKDQVFKF